MSNHATYSAYPTRIIVPHASFLAYAPRGPGIMCALFYFAEDKDICGWWIGSRGGEFIPAYFVLMDFYAAANTRCYATQGGDLYGGWRYDYERAEPELDAPIAADDALRHRLEQLQYEFSQEWLFFADEPAARPEIAEYESAGLPLQAVNIRYRKLARLQTGAAVWVYRSPDADMNVVDYLRQRWPLDYRLE